MEVYDSMVKWNFKVALMAIASSSPALADVLEPAPVKIGGIDLIPQLTLDQRYDDNLFLQSNDTRESWQTLVIPQVKALALDGANEYSLDYRAEAGFYENSSDDNYLDQLISARGFWNSLTRHRFELVGRYQRDHDRRGARYFEGSEAFLIDEPARFEQESVLGRYSYGAENASGRLEFEARAHDRDYLNFRERTARRDRLEGYGTGRFLWRIAGRARALFEVTGGAIDYEKDPASVEGSKDRLDSVYTSYLAGVTWKLAGKTSGTLKVGHASKDFLDDDREDFSGTSWEGELSWAPKTYSVFTLLTGRRSEESKGRGDFIDAVDVGIDWRHEWSDRIESRLHYVHSDEDYVADPEGRDDTISQYGFRLDYAVRRWLSLGLFYVHDRRESNLLEYDYDRDVGGVRVRMSL